MCGGPTLVNIKRPTPRGHRPLGTNHNQVVSGSGLLLIQILKWRRVHQQRIRDVPHDVISLIVARRDLRTDSGELLSPGFDGLTVRIRRKWLGTNARIHRKHYPVWKGRNRPEERIDTVGCRPARHPVGQSHRLTLYSSASGGIATAEMSAKTGIYAQH
jgi:hypothetical protein